MLVCSTLSSHGLSLPELMAKHPEVSRDIGALTKIRLPGGQTFAITDLEFDSATGANFLEHFYNSTLCALLAVLQSCSLTQRYGGSPKNLPELISLMNFFLFYNRFLKTEDSIGLTLSQTGPFTSIGQSFLSLLKYFGQSKSLNALSFCGTLVAMGNEPRYKVLDALETYRSKFKLTGHHKSTLEQHIERILRGAKQICQLQKQSTTVNQTLPKIILSTDLLAQTSGQEVDPIVFLPAMETDYWIEFFRGTHPLLMILKLHQLKFDANSLENSFESTVLVIFNIKNQFGKKTLKIKVYTFNPELKQKALLPVIIKILNRTINLHTSDNRPAVEIDAAIQFQQEHIIAQDKGSDQEIIGLKDLQAIAPVAQQETAERPFLKAAIVMTRLMPAAVAVASRRQAINRQALGATSGRKTTYLAQSAEPYHQSGHSRTISPWSGGVSLTSDGRGGRGTNTRTDAQTMPSKAQDESELELNDLNNLQGRDLRDGGQDSEQYSDAEIYSSTTTASTDQKKLAQEIQQRFTENLKTMAPAEALDKACQDCGIKDSSEENLAQELGVAAQSLEDAFENSAQEYAQTDEVEEQESQGEAPELDTIEEAREEEVIDQSSPMPRAEEAEPDRSIDQQLEQEDKQALRPVPSELPSPERPARTEAGIPPQDPGALIGLPDMPLTAGKAPELEDPRVENSQEKPSDQGLARRALNTGKRAAQGLARGLWEAAKKAGRAVGSYAANTEG